MSVTFLTARQAIKTSAQDCEIRGGEYVLYDRSNYATALKVWLPQAEQGDPTAQNYVGEIYEKGLGVAPDHGAAASWYRKAAEQGYARAQINLGFLYEKGLGVEKDPAKALSWYRKASGLSGAIVLNSGVASEPPPKAAPATSPTKTATEAPVDVAPPAIQIIDPPVLVTRGRPSVAVRSGMSVREVVGKVNTPAGLYSFTVNDHSERTDKNGLFHVDVPVLGTTTPVNIVAVDKRGKRTEVQFTLVPEELTAATVAAATEAPLPSRLGVFYALVIGNEQYTELPKLSTAVNDAKSIAEILTKKYGFKTTLLVNATRYDILSSLNAMREKLGKNDNLLIYYAGHGELDRVNFRGYWLPVDAEPKSPANWISNISVTDMLNAMAAKHVLVIADSCYSGAMTLSSVDQMEPGASDQQRLQWMKVIGNTRSRTVLSSGGLRPVMDAGGGNHSVFAKAVLDVLQANQDALEGQRLFREVSARVVYTALRYKFEQIPQYAPIRFAGHEAGDFLFVPLRQQESIAPMFGSNRLSSAR